jgi:hypothetical protein
MSVSLAANENSTPFDVPRLRRCGQDKACIELSAMAIDVYRLRQYDYRPATTDRVSLT